MENKNYKTHTIPYGQRKKMIVGGDSTVSAFECGMPHPEVREIKNLEMSARTGLVVLNTES